MDVGVRQTTPGVPKDGPDQIDDIEVLPSNPYAPGNEERGHILFMKSAIVRDTVTTMMMAGGGKRGKIPDRLTGIAL